MKKAFLALLLLTAPLAASEIGDCVARYSKVTVWVDFNNVSLRKFGAFNPAAKYIHYGNGDEFKARYGVGLNEFKGNLGGERYSPMHVFNALPVICPELPASYQLTEQDRNDILFVSYPPGSAANIFDALFLKTSLKLYPPDPAPVPAPPPAPKPPPPVPSPCSAACIPQPLPKEALDTINEAKGWKLIGPGRAARLSKAEKLLREYKPCLQSTGQNVMNLHDGAWGFAPEIGSAQMTYSIGSFESQP